MDSNISYDTGVLQAKSRRLVVMASIESQKHIRDDTIKARLIKAYSDTSSDIVRQFQLGQQSLEQSIESIDQEIRELTNQSSRILETYKDPIMKGIGLAAGIAQVIGGGYGALMSGGTSIFFDLTLLNGLNNVYENGVYFITGNKDAQGFMRQLYKLAAKYSDQPEIYGSLAYSISDLFLSGLGLFSLSKEVKIIESGVFAGNKKFTLFRAFDSELLREYQTMSRPMLSLEGGSDIITIDGIVNDINALEKRSPHTMDAALKEMIRNQH
ncbi:DUF4225 domain-containing protein [Vibrio viridaestus]|uniref:DUF4225 domain-containing protein n=1 Tax=Vibrio viridaestus TaxID=2487322 RepID=UPI00140B3E65|nr:DUF4225 domain-containing protein [Vibrio viridaestus]